MTTGRSLLVGVDVGTTLTKAGLVDLQGREVGWASAPTVWERVPTGAEARPEDLLAAVVRALAEVLSTAPGAEILAVGVTSMAETVVLLDAGGQPVGPAVAWHDVRARDEFADLNATFGVDAIGRRTGLGTEQMPSLPTLRWLARNVPGTGRAARALSVAEWIVHALGGDVAAEASLASRTGVLSVATRQWWPEVLEWAGLATDLFPEVRTAGSPWGRASGDAPGLERLRGVALTVAGHDHVCASVGIGITAPTQVMDSCGTAEALMRAVPADADRDLSAGLAQAISTGWHVLPGRYMLLGGSPLGLELMAVLQALEAHTAHGHTELDAAALELIDRPPLDAAAADADGPAAVWRAVVSSRVAAALGLLRGLEELGGPVSEVRMTGGWAHNPVLRRLKAVSFPAQVYPGVEEAGVRGAALLAGQAAGVYADARQFPAPEVEDRRPQPGRPTLVRRTRPAVTTPDLPPRSGVNTPDLPPRSGVTRRISRQESDSTR